ncbi:MAG: BamA/TamA family outer membrane protein [Paludibacteraceae bacterium]|nr:BamA/TamA family outer membrane protein [Paludibacteraceae bacterium]
MTIADIKITGASSYEDYVLIGFSGLNKGQQIRVPGADLTNVVKRFWKQGFFSDVKILCDTMRNDSIWLTIALKQLPRVSIVNFYGLKKSDIEDLEKTLEIQKGKQLNADAIDRTKIAIRKFLSEKGFHNAEILVYQKNDPTVEGNVIVDISVDKREKVKVNDIIVRGNEAMDIAKIDRAMKKTNRAGKIANIFRAKKFVAKEYENDKKTLVEKYNEIGYRDAVIVSDTIVKRDDGKVDVYLEVDEGKKYYFGDIKWLGNTLYPSEYLNQLLNVKKGETYNLKDLNKRLFEDEDAVSAIYKDNGYLFMNIDPVEVGIDGDSINFEMRVYEGQQATINRVIINGNTRVYEHVVRREMRTKPGSLYSQSDLIRTLRELAQIKQFDEEKIFTGVDLQPNPEDGTVDIAYNLETKSSDQVEFSAGWGQSGIVLSVGLKFSNFAIQNIFKPKTYRIVPQGEGQTLSLKAQANGMYYQNYSISFFDPWLGGKRPNSFSVSFFYSVQTGLSNRYYENYSYMYNYYNNYYNNYYGNDYYYGTNNYGTEYDKNVFMRTIGASVGYGTRLKWPDDYFTFYGNISYQRYNLKNWFKSYYGFETGVTNDLSLGLNISRNSIDNPIYTRRGSSLSLSVAATFPYSLLTKDVDYASMDLATRSKWIEYHKWKFNAKFFVPLTYDNKLVLMARADYGFLGYYNKDKRSPFGKFYVGGDGMSGYTTAGTETVGLRGYEAGSLTPYSGEGYYGYNGNLYTKLTVELRYPLLLNQSTNIWALAFVEAGNAWAEFKDFNPFDLKRSAGAGVRVYLPMFGLLGIDWAYGFDHDQTGRRGGSQFHFILGQEF